MREKDKRRNRFFSFLLADDVDKKKTLKKKKNFFQAKLSRNEVLWIQRVYSGETMKGRTPSLQEACAPAGGKAPLALPTLEEFRHLTAVVASYAFHLPDDEGTDRTVMLPLLDLVNHANAGVANAVVAREGEDFTARALRDIREGEEVSLFFPFAFFFEREGKKEEKMPLFIRVGLYTGCSPPFSLFLLLPIDASRCDVSIGTKNLL